MSKKGGVVNFLEFIIKERGVGCNFILIVLSDKIILYMLQILDFTGNLVKLFKQYTTKSLQKKITWTSMYFEYCQV